VFYSVVYDANGGNADGPADVTHLLDGAVVTLSSTVPTHVAVGGIPILFVGWSLAPVTYILEAANTSVLYSLVTSVTIDGENITVYALWGYDRNGNNVPDVLETQYSVMYNANGGSATGTPAETSRLYNEVIQIASAADITPPVGKYFLKWNTQANGGGITYDVGSDYNMPPNDLKLYAIWDDILYTVTYDANGGSVTGTPPTEPDKKYGGTFRAADADGFSAPAGKQFAGWNTQANGSGTGYAFDALVTIDSPENITLYAIWEHIPVGVLDNSHTDGYDAASGADLVIRLNADPEYLLDVYLNGTKLTKGTHYKVDRGSTIVTVFASYMKTLPTGDHTFGAMFSTGAAFVDLSVTGLSTGDGEDSGNGGSGMIIAVVAVVAIAAVGAVAYFVLVKKK